MQPAPKKYDLDLSKMGDEELVVLAKECGYQPALQELLGRYHEWTACRIAQQAKRTRLKATDVEDAQQNAVFATVEAVSRYDTCEMVKPNGCSFRTFLRIVLTGRFRDFVKHVGRVARHYDPAVGGADAGDAPLDPAEVQAACQAWRHQETTDPAKAAEWHEALLRLDQALNRLEPHQRFLWDRLVFGTPLRCIARELGVSYDTAKRQRQRLLAELTSQLRE